MTNQETIFYFDSFKSEWKHCSEDYPIEEILDIFNYDSKYNDILKTKLSRVANARQTLKSNANLKSQPLKLISYLLEANHINGFNAAKKIYSLRSEKPGLHFAYLDLFRQLQTIPKLSFLPIQQLYLSKEIPENVLLCFTGRTGRLNMPLPIFHERTTKHFDCIAYLYDPFNDYYSSIDNTIRLAIDGIKDKWPKARIVSLSTSTGGIMAHKLSNEYQDMKKLSFSPLLSKSDFLLEQMKSQGNKIFKSTRFFFALGSNSHKHKSADELSLKILFQNLDPNYILSNIFNLGFLNSSHATLLTLMRMNLKAYHAQINWLKTHE